MNAIKAWFFGILQRLFRSRGMELVAAGTEERLTAQLQAPAITATGKLLTLQGIDLVLDVGAAVGMYGGSLRAAGYEGRIVSFEPLSKPFAELREAAAGDPLWECRNIAIGPEPGTAEINVAGNSDSSSMLPMEELHIASAPGTAYVGTETVEVGTLDLLWDEVVGDAKRPFLKLDVQGFELEVLKGAEKSLPRVCGIQTELSFQPLYEGGPLWEEVIASIREQGFHVAGFEPGHADVRTGEMLQVDGVFVRD